MLDHLSRGRLDVGIGRGAVPYEIEYYGADPKEAQARYMEAYAVLVKALFATVTADGTIRVIEAALMRAVSAVLYCPLPPLLEEADPTSLAA